MSVLIKHVIPGSPAAKAGIEAGTRLVSVNGQPINDVLDYMFYADDGMGLEFESFLMSEKRHCGNKCIFCFIDQLPKDSCLAKPLRPSLRFKDDDSRLSFLQGNYITLTNLSEQDIRRIIAMRTPVNISVHTTNPELRSFMLGNPKGGQSLETLWRFAEAGISMNCQLVLCPELNDGQELTRSLRDLTQYNCIESIACVPVGLSKHREGLYPLRGFTQDEARAVIAIVGGFPRCCAADEFYLTAELRLPPAEYYGSFPQYENGVGMISHMREKLFEQIQLSIVNCQLSTVVTGMAAFPFICEAFSPYPNVNVAAIRNDFFGESITVSGLLTGGDIIAQLREFPALGEVVLIASTTLNTDGLFLDDLTVADVEKALGVKVQVVKI
ncbi:MAG: DUF512 domain-containing protein [Oscillospiraceae bacterium]|nr:DUF512 domain-containing protein [Oscillospiraceae bacterium]